MVCEVGSLDQKMLRIHLSVSGLSLASTLFTSRPVTTAFSKRPFQVFIGLMGFMVFALAIAQWTTVFESLSREAREWRFTILQRRSAALPNPDPSGTFVVKYQGFALPSRQLLWSEDGTSAILKMNTVVPIADEWCFRTDAKDSSKDPVRFQLHASDDGKSWRQVASSTSFVELMGGDGYYDGEFDTPDVRGVFVCFGMANNFGWMIVGSLTMTVQSICFVIMFAFLWRGNEDLARKVYGCGVGFVGGNLINLGVGAWWTVGYDASVKYFLSSIVPFIWSFFLIFREDRFITGVMLGSVADLLVNFSRFDGDVAHLGWLCGIHTVVLVFGYWVHHFRSRLLKDAKAVVAMDKQKYDAAWHKLRDEELDGIYRLQTLARKCTETRDAVQIDASGKKKTSLDQLYYEATAAQPVMERKVLRWGRGCNGFLPLLSKRDARARRSSEIAEIDLSSAAAAAAAAAAAKKCGDDGLGVLPLEPPRSPCHASESGEVEDECAASGSAPEMPQMLKCSELPETTAGRAKVKWPAIKSSSRAIEKVYRSYRGDVSNLVDLCRETLVFVEIRDVMACLKEILADPEVRVVRVKNFFDPDFDAAQTAGYRHVMVNVEIRGAPEAGEWRHVCEVQLQLASFYQLRSQQGHQRYVRFRNLSGT